MKLRFPQAPAAAAAATAPPPSPAWLPKRCTNCCTSAVSRRGSHTHLLSSSRCQGLAGTNVRPASRKHTACGHGCWPVRVCVCGGALGHLPPPAPGRHESAAHCMLPPLPGSHPCPAQWRHRTGAILLAPTPCHTVPCPAQGPRLARYLPPTCRMSSSWYMSSSSWKKRYPLRYRPPGRLATRLSSRTPAWRDGVCVCGGGGVSAWVSQGGHGRCASHQNTASSGLLAIAACPSRPVAALPPPRPRRHPLAFLEGHLLLCGIRPGQRQHQQLAALPRSIAVLLQRPQALPQLHNLVVAPPALLVAAQGGQGTVRGDRPCCPARRKEQPGSAAARHGALPPLPPQPQADRNATPFGTPLPCPTNSRPDYTHTCTPHTIPGAPPSPLTCCASRCGAGAWCCAPPPPGAPPRTAHKHPRRRSRRAAPPPQAHRQPSLRAGGGGVGGAIVVWWCSMMGMVGHACCGTVCVCCIVQKGHDEWAWLTVQACLDAW